jgi:Flp pilus assembly protein TadD
MHEVTEPPKKGIPNPWIVAGLSALSLSLLIITVIDGSEAAKNEKALAASRTEAAHQRTLLQGKVDTLTAEHAATSRAGAQRFAAAEKRIAELTAELTRFRKEEATPPKVTEMILKGEAASRKPVLLAEALKAWDDGDLDEAKGKFEAILAIDPNDAGAREGLGMVNYEINDTADAKKAAVRSPGD